ncbi:MAG: ribonuclease R [Gammaproteobacteria bacterium]|nr:ribonuclease R [Gammaproteobacteria bacterium]
MTSKLDPHAEREAEKYENPIASREFLLEIIKAHGSPMTFERLLLNLGYDDDERIEALRRRLRAMERDGQLIRNRKGGYVPLDKSELVRGRVIGHKDGFGFLVPDEGGDDVFLSARQMRALMHGDRAVVQITGIDHRGRREGAVVEVLERANAEVVGRLVLESGVAFVIPDNKRMTQDVLIQPDGLGEARDGQIVRVQLIKQPTFRNKPVGRVIEVLGDHMAPGMEINVAIHTYGLRHEWPEDVLAQIAGLSEEVVESDKLGRVDLRDVPLITIDDEDARDFDDAVYCEPTAKGWRLIVAIADVSHYVTVGSPLDREAFLRSTSVYFPGRVIPMLPEILSNGLCSINPHVDRLCMVCEMLINREGDIIRSRFYEGVMRSHARMTYTQVAKILLDNDAALRKEYASIVPHLESLHGLYGVLMEARIRRGAMDFDTTETKIVFGEGRKIEAIVPYERNDAHRLIEECMIAANVAAARFLERRKIEGLYRVHDRPAAEKIADLRTFLGELGLTLGGGDKPEAKDFNAVLEAAKGREDQHLIQTVVLRTMKQAVYSPDNIGHFGLALANYTHFTSPIRRYPDLLVHRAIRHILRTGGPEHFPYTHDELSLIGEYCSNNERRADEATRDATDWLKCEFMQDRVGEVFEGVISAVTSFGLFVELKGVFVEGLLHITALDKDYYHFDPVGHRLVGERSGQVYRLGDAITVQVARVDLDERKIDFILPRGEVKPAADATAEQAPGKKKRRRRKKTGKGGGEAVAENPVSVSPDEDFDEHEPGDVNGNMLIEDTESQPKLKKRRRRPPRRVKPE